MELLRLKKFTRDRGIHTLSELMDYIEYLEDVKRYYGEVTNMIRDMYQKHFQGNKSGSC